MTGRHSFCKKTCCSYPPGFFLCETLPSFAWLWERRPVKPKTKCVRVCVYWFVLNWLLSDWSEVERQSTRAAAEWRWLSMLTGLSAHRFLRSASCASWRQCHARPVCDWLFAVSHVSQSTRVCACVVLGNCRVTLCSVFVTLHISLSLPLSAAAFSWSSGGPGG